jgi:hypothetical protein
MPDGFVVRECDVAAEALIGGTAYDYADSFELLLAEPDQHVASEWMEVVLGDASPALMALVAFVHTKVAGFRGGRADGVGMPGWQVVHMDDDVVMLEASGSLLRAVIVARRVSSMRLTFTTFLFYRSPRAGRMWWFVRPLHQRVARYLLANAAAATARRNDEAISVSGGGPPSPPAPFRPDRAPAGPPAG